MSFAFKIDKALKANLYKICRLCGIDREEMVDILDNVAPDNNQPVDCDGELKLYQKIIQCIGITVSKDDKMPQMACSLCVDKINDFFEFREMCYATDVQTRKLLGLKGESNKKNANLDVKPIVKPILKPTLKPIIDIKEETVGKRGRKRKADDAVPKEDSTSTPEVKREIAAPTTSNKKQRLNEPPTLETKKKGKLTGKQVDKAVKPKEEIKEEPVDGGEKPTTVPAEKSTATKFRQVCNICSQRFASKLKLEQHVAVTHIPHIPRYVCTACNETIKKNNDIKSHQLWHKLTKTPYMCGHCGQSLISSYAYSRHLRDHTVEIPPNLWVLDRECPQCHQTFLTNFLYNTHICAVKTKKCAGCNRQLRNEVEYQRHAAHCNKVYLNYSKHIPAAVAAAESSIRIKNENDVEAAAAEALARNAGISLDMTPIVSLTRITTPEIMAARQGITDYTDENATAPHTTDDPKTTPGKKANKKGVSRKDLKRVDNMLKSTLDALVSIKHEPEVHVETDVAENPATTEENANKNDVDSATAAPDDGDFQHADDFHHGDDDDDDDGGGGGGAATTATTAISGDKNASNAAVDATVSTHTNEVFVKKEPVEGIQAEGTINIKQEVIDVDKESSAASAASKMPVLKLKIKKEHGTLNSSIVEEQNVRGERKKKKKKRKEAARNKDKSSDGDEQPEGTATVQADTDAVMATLLEPNVVLTIKQEKMDDRDVSTAENHTAVGSSETMQLEPTVMTTIPIPQFQISAISSGVEFGESVTTTAGADAIDDAQNETSDAAATSEISTTTTTDEREMEDVKPNKAELDRLFKITNVSSGVQMEHEMMDTENDDDRDAETSEQIGGEVPAEQESDQPPVTSVTETTYHKKTLKSTTTKAIKHKAAEQKSRVAPARSAKAFKSTAGVPKSNTNTSHMSTSSVETPSIDFSQIQIKPEPIDRGYEDVFNAYESATNPSIALQHQSLHENQQQEDEELSSREIAEQEYLNNIDFANIQIKQEKDLDVSDVEITNTHIVANAIPNGMKRANGEESQYFENKQNRNTMNSEETDDGEDDDDDDEEDDDDDDDDDDDWDGVKEESVEKREYRELEMPPLLTSDQDEPTDQNSANESTAENNGELNAGILETVGAAIDTHEPLAAAAIAEEQVVAENNANLTTDTNQDNIAHNILNEPTTSSVELAYSNPISNDTELSPPPFLITGIFSQADSLMANQLPEIMANTDVPMIETPYHEVGAIINSHTAPPSISTEEAPTLKISSVFAGCSATFDDLPKQGEPQDEMSLTYPTATTEPMEITYEAPNSNLLHEATDAEAFKEGMPDATMDTTTTATPTTTPAIHSIRMEVTEEKDALLEAQPIFDNNDVSVAIPILTATTTTTTGTALDASQITTTTTTATHTNAENNGHLGITIQNVVAGIAATNAMGESIEEEAQNLLNHEVFEAQANQHLATFGITNQQPTIVNTQLATGNVEEAENLMNECVAEALRIQREQQQQQLGEEGQQLQQVQEQQQQQIQEQQQQQQIQEQQQLQLQQEKQQVQHQNADVLLGGSSGSANLLMNLHDPTNTATHAYSDVNKSNAAEGANDNTVVGFISRSNPNTNHPFMLDDSNINEIAENNNNANIERELQDDVAAAANDTTTTTNTTTTTATATSTTTATTTSTTTNENPIEEQSNMELMENRTNDIS